MKQIKTNANTNGVVLGSGTLHFGDFDIKVNGVECTVEHSWDSAAEATFTTHNFEIIQREEKEEVEKEKTDELCSIEVVFDSGGKIYEYLIDSDAFWSVGIGNQYFILNEAGYDYRNAKVTVKKWNEWPSEAATKRIIALSSSSRKGFWIDDGFIANNRPRQKMVDQWREKIYAEDNFRDIIAGKVEEVKHGNSVTKTISGRIPISPIKPTFEKEYEAYFNGNDNKGDDNMNIFGNIEFGKLKHRNAYALTLKGLAYLKNAHVDEGSSRSYVQYDPETDSVEDVTPFVLKDVDIKDFIYKMPVALSAVSRGDIILDKGMPVFVKEVNGSTFTVVEPYTCEVKTLLTAKNAFGFNYVTKVVNLMDNFNLAGAASADNPFGNLLPLMMLSGNKNMEDMMPLFLMGSGAMEGDLTSNPMMMYFLMKDGKMNDMLPFFLMSKGGLFNAPAKEKANEEI
jgi:hypothetical protein